MDQLRAAAEAAKQALTQVDEADAYWSEYDVPLTLHANVRSALAGLTATLAAPVERQEAEAAWQLQGGMSNVELVMALNAKLPGVKPTDGELSAFALGVEVGMARASLPASPSQGQTAAARDVLAERQRQIDTEGYTPEHDDKEHNSDELARAAAVYANPEIWDILGHGPVGWPWAPQWFKPKDARRNYVRAAALLLAAIEIEDRAAPSQPVQGDA